MNNLVMVSGDSRTFDFSVTVGSGGEFDDLTGATVQFAVDGLFTKTNGDGVTVTALTGAIVATVVPADTEDVDHRHAYRYDVQITEADGTVTTIRRGWFIVTPDVDAE